MWPANLTSFFILPLLTWARLDCSRNEYERCVRIADPLVKEAHLVFPDNLNDIDLVCKTWNRFVDCLKIYTDYCFTDQQRRQFNKAVENPIESVHQMCMQPSYQEEYLHYAPCIKSTITERLHCGTHYNLLVDQVSQGEIISKSTLCCSHDRFKQCVQKETRRLCDRGIPDGPATRFSSQIIDKALSFLQDQCLNYIPNSGDCSTLTTDTLAYSDPLSISTSSSELYPWSTLQQQQHDLVAKEIFPSRVSPPKMSTTVSSWLPSSSLPIDSSQQQQQQTSDSVSTQQQILGSRTRPASYGRSNSWSDSSSTSNGQTVQMFPELASSTTVAPRADWARVANWSKLNNEPVIVSSTWYPAAGSQLVNEVDEPNQQGLTKFRNAAGNLNDHLMTLTVFMMAIIGTVFF